jgi:hypothetical protein
VINPSQDYNPVSLHFAANIDFNGDCNSDLVMVSLSSKLNSVIEFYQKANNNNYEQLSTQTYGKNISWLTFADLDSNGAPDLFIVAQEGTVLTAFAVLNPNVPSDICSPSSQFAFAGKVLQTVTLPSGYALSGNSNIKFADVNFDGLPDMLGLFTVGKFRRATALVNNGYLSFEELGGLNIE